MKVLSTSVLEVLEPITSNNSQVRKQVINLQRVSFYSAEKYQQINQLLNNDTELTEKFIRHCNEVSEINNEEFTAFVDSWKTLFESREEVCKTLGKDYLSSVIYTADVLSKVFSSSIEDDVVIMQDALRAGEKETSQTLTSMHKVVAELGQQTTKLISYFQEISMGMAKNKQNGGINDSEFMLLYQKTSNISSQLQSSIVKHQEKNAPALQAAGTMNY